MSTPQEFMERVVAWPGSAQEPGWINAHWTVPEDRGHGVRGKPFKDLHEFMNFVQYAAAQPARFKEIYFCLSTQSHTGKLIKGKPVAQRLKQHALKLKAIWLDVDVKEGKGYATVEEALKAIFKFQVHAQLPGPSALVLSGGGVHVYWISKKPLTPDVWRPYAEGLKAEALRLGLKCDAGLTTDEARILRVPGTFNNKTSEARPVKLAQLGASYDFVRDLTRLYDCAPPYLGSPVTAPVTAGAPPFDMSAFLGQAPDPAFGALDPLADILGSGVGHGKDDRPLNPDQVFKSCVHFRDSVINHGVGQSQGLWMLTGLASTWLDDGRDWFHYMSKGYPTYDPAETDAMYDRKLKERAERNLGWPACSAFEGEGAKCKTCPLYKKLRSPLNLAERVVSPGEVAQPAPPPPEDLGLPAGYTVDPDTGYICKVVTKTVERNGQEETIEEMVPLFWSKLRNFVLQGGHRQILFETSLDKDKWGQARITELDLAMEQTTIKALRRDGVKPNPDQQKGIITFMTSFMAKLDAAKYRIETLPFGWLKNPEGGDLPIGFAYGGRVVMAGGAMQKAGYADREIEKYYMPKGNPDLWHQACKIVTDQRHPALEAIICSSFASPLLLFTGKYNSIICPWSKGSGAHKTTSIHIGAAVWGSPNATKERPTASQKGLLHKLGEIRNLPLYLDEINEHPLMDKVRAMIGDATEGGTGSKLHQDRTFFQQDRWQTLMLVGSNVSMIENILMNTKGTDAKMQRVFDFQVEARGDTLPENDVTTLITALDDNYGHVGLAYSEVLGRDPAGIKAFVTEVVNKFNSEVQHKSPERFRSAVAGTTYAGAALANQHLGTDFHLPELWDFLKQQYLLQRTGIIEAEIVGGTKANTTNAITQFFKACVNNSLWVGALPGPGKPVVTYVGGVTRDRPAKIHIRFGVDDAQMEISKEALLEHLKRVDHDGGSVILGLKNHFGASEHPKINLAAGAGVLGGRETIIRVPVPLDSPFLGPLHTHTPMDKRPPIPTEEEDVIIPAPVDGALARAAGQAAADLALVASGGPKDA